MTNAIQYLAENAAYVDENSAINIEGMTDEQFAAANEALADLMMGEDLGIGCTVAKTYETIADFIDTKNTRWAECGKTTETTVAGFPAVHFQRFQIARGKPRQPDMVVIDFGTHRIALVYG